MKDVITDQLVIGVLIGIIPSAIAFAKFWMDMGSTRNEADAARKSANEAHKRIDDIAKLNATTEDVVDVERRFTDAIDAIRGDFRHMVGRLDQVLINLAGNKS